MLTEPIFLPHPAHRGDADEALHAAPPEVGDRLFGDTVWLSACDPERGIWGLIHMHISTNKSLGRFAAYFCIDGVEQFYLSTARKDFAPGATGWSDGAMRYDVVKPYEHLRVTLDGPKFAFDFDYRARHVTFDYDDCPGGSPLAGLAPAATVNGGHYEQALDLRGTFEVRGGPAAGQVRQIETIAHRDHTWSDRFGSVAPWTYPAVAETGLHFWHVLHFPDRNVNAVGFYDLSALGVERDSNRVGGFASSTLGTRPIVECTAVDEQLSAPRGSTTPLRWRYVLDGGEVFHVAMTRVHHVFKLRMLGEDDGESRLNDFETFGELLIEETGERGFGQFEHSTLPPNPRWLA